MASSTGQSNRPSSSNAQSQGSRAGEKWTEDEEAWLVVNSMNDVTLAWLTENFPGGTRGLNGISGHLNDMRLHKRLSRKWRNKTWDDEPPYTLREDTEIMQWHVWGREHIDPEIFVLNQRAGGSVIARADYLSEDEELVRIVKEAEKASQAALEAQDEASYNTKYPTEEDPADWFALGATTTQLMRAEGENLARIRNAITRSIANREGEHEADDESDEEGFDEDN